MDPQIRFARASDGVSIAYLQVGQGKALVVLPAPPGAHIALEWRTVPTTRALAEGIAARGRSVVYFDTRGCGSSGRDAATYSLDAFVWDLECVVDALDLKTFDIYSLPAITPIAITYATRHPERVAHLGLYAPFARYRDLGTSPAFQAIWALRGQDWETYAQSYSFIMGGFQWGNDRQTTGTLVRDATTLEIAKRIWDVFDKEFDVVDLLSAVRVPTLVVEPTGEAAKVFPPQFARAVAQAITGAQLVATANPAELFSVLGRFFEILDDSESLPPDLERQISPVHDSIPTSAIVLFTDIAESTSLTERIGDAAFRDASRSLDDALRAAMRQHNGTPVEGKLLGDGVMGVFASAARAIAAARRCVELSNDLPLHIGLHAGDVIREGDNVYGGAVNIAARICGLCAPGEILVSATVRDLARTSAGVTFEDRGEQALKGVADPVRVFAVR